MISATWAIQSIAGSQRKCADILDNVFFFWERSKRYFPCSLSSHEEGRNELACWILIPVLYIGLSQLDLHEDDLSISILLSIYVD